MENTSNAYKIIPNNTTKNDYNDTTKEFNIISHFETDVGNNTIHSNESLSNIIDIINNNNLNLFYQDDDSNNFKRNIDSLNLKFYLETEKILSSNTINSENLFFILFKQITLYIKEIERLNIIILGLKKDQESTKKMEYFIQKREMDFENKINMINALRYSKDDLEKKVNNLMVSENNLKKENLRLIQENQLYKTNNNSNINILKNSLNNISHINDKEKEKGKYISNNDKKKNKYDLNLNKKYIKTNSNYINNNQKNTYNCLKSNNISNNKIIKMNKEMNKIYNNNEKDSKSIIISVKRDEHLLKGHRRNYSDQIGVGIKCENLNFNINNNVNNYNSSNKKMPKNNNTIKINKNNIISFGVSTPKNKPIPIKHNQLSGVKITSNSKYKTSKSIKNDKEKKIFNKKKTYNITNKSINIDFKSIDKNNYLMKSSSLLYNKNNLKEKIKGSNIINSTENNYEIVLENEIDQLSAMENLLNQVKDYINSNRNSKNLITHTILNIKK